MLTKIDVSGLSRNEIKSLKDLVKQKKPTAYATNPMHSQWTKWSTECDYN